MRIMKNGSKRILEMKSALQNYECPALSALDAHTKRQIMALRGGFDLRQKWLESVQIKGNSLKTYERALQAFELFCKDNGVQNLSGLTADFMRQYANFLQSKAASTRALYLQAARRFITFLHVNGFLPFNIAANLKIQGARQNSFKKDYLNAEAASALIQAQNGADLISLRNKAMLALMVTGGLRTCEIAAARLGDFDNLHGQQVLYVLGKGRVEKVDFVKIAPAVDSLIKEYLQARQRAGEILDDSSPLFATHGNKFATILRALSTRSISYIVKSAMRKNGIDSRRFTAHSLRHTAAVLSLKSGCSLTDTMQFMRHKNVATTQIYTHSIERENNNSELRIAAAVFA